ncbi:MAG: Methylenetetrahydrofolate--tRNA-(uracil-5-)-methyltransferase TrmFO [Syntrophorhabdus sp. PtaU1.Bin050]|nr:MAG: Methylenetetrahydrofolate--tRNA-(uracil-5-)-methyltransferase TrmFO [Syntrophorhabdus sp. PtaU1.Bin050]
MDIRVIGGGLAGVETAYQIAQRGRKVTLYEMRPHTFTPAHRTPFLSELVCSNSLKSKELTNAHGLLKEEMRLLGSITVRTADKTAIQGGKALVVDRQRFSQSITNEIEAHPLIRISREEITQVPPDGIVIIATGPLTSDRLADALRVLTGSSNFYFFDAISPIVDGETIDRKKAFFGARYQDRSDDYLNCPLTRDEYDRFYNALIAAERVQLREFEKTPYFEGCLPIEIMAERGRQTLLYGPMKPVGLMDSTTGTKPYAVIQLRREDAFGTMYNMVGFQTKLTYTEQERIFKLIPALRNAVFLRYGSIHRNTYINSPVVLTRDLRLSGSKRVFLAGQITGVEGYIESAAMGLLAGVSVCTSLEGHAFAPPPEDTCIGALLNYITTENKHFQPMNVNFGLLKGYNKKYKDAVVKNALSAISIWKDDVDRLRPLLE